MPFRLLPGLRRLYADYDASAAFLHFLDIHGFTAGDGVYKNTVQAAARQACTMGLRELLLYRQYARACRASILT